MSGLKIDGFDILGTEAFRDFYKERGFDHLSEGYSFGDRNDFSSTKEGKDGDFRHVGVAYQISGFGSINMTEESFMAHLEIKFVYRIDAADAKQYRKLKDCTPTGGFQAMFDQGDLNFPPPIVTCRNAIVEAAPIREQVTSVDLMRPQHGPDGYFVTLTGEYRMQCHETIRHEKFPFSRQALQVRLVCKQPMKKVLLAPYCVVAPPWKFEQEDEIAFGVTEPSKNFDFQRPNLYKHFTKDLGTWEFVGHHIAFVPMELTPRMPSGAQFSRMYITMQIEQLPGFYTYKLVPVLFPLMLISNVFFITENISTAALGQQISIFFAMAAYTLITTSWQPAASVLSYLDKYILFALGSVLLTSVWVTIRMLGLLISDDEDGFSNTTDPSTATISAEVTLEEQIVWSVIASFNLLGHVFFLIIASSTHRRRRFINATWRSVFEDEKRELKKLLKDDEAKNTKNTKDHNDIWKSLKPTPASRAL